MSNEIKVSLPKLGESIVSASVVQWFKKVGDRVELDEVLLEVSTDKVNSEIPSPVSGIIEKIVAGDGVEIAVGEILCLITTQNFVREVAKEEIRAQACSKSTMQDVYSPSVIRLLQEKGLKLEALDQIPRSGAGGRLTKKDVENYTPALFSEDGTERVKMSTLRKAIAENMVRSFYEAPHATLATEVDVTRIVKYIQEEKEAFLKEHGVKLTVTSFVAFAIAKALQSFPLLNSSLDGDTILMKKFVNLGIAVSVEEGVMVPVIAHCHRLSIVEIAKQIADLGLRARTAKLKNSDVQEGTITMTNFGMTGTMVGIPIIRYPEVAIVGLGAITKKVVVMPDDSLAIRSILWTSLTFDHRVLDGLYGCGFLNALKKILEEEPRQFLK